MPGNSTISSIMPSTKNWKNIRANCNALRKKGTTKRRKF
jgi:hypothetical protein